MKLCLQFFFLVLALSEGTLAACPVDVESSMRIITTTQGIQPEQREFPRQLWSAHQDLAKKIWTLFQSGQSVGEQVQPCLKPPLSQKNLNFAINEIFFRQSVETMRVSNPQIFSVMAKKQNIFNLAFSVLRSCEACIHQYDKLAEQRSAHFNHSTQAILADVARLTFADWKIIFIHEVGHYFFPDKQSNDAFLDGKKMVEIEKIVKAKSTEEKLSDDERLKIDDWLMNGIRTKLIAEWRIWSFTLNFLKDVKDLEFGQQTSWLRQYHQLPETVKYVELFKALESNFKQPIEGLESHPIILQRLEQLRRKLIQQVETEHLRPEININ